MSNLCNVDEDGTVSAGTLDEEQLESLRQTLPFRELVENEDDHGRLHGVMYPKNVQRARLSVCKRPRMVAGGEKFSLVSLNGAHTSLVSRYSSFSIYAC